MGFYYEDGDNSLEDSRMVAAIIENGFTRETPIGSLPAGFKDHLDEMVRTFYMSDMKGRERNAVKQDVYNGLTVEWALASCPPFEKGVEHIYDDLVISKNDRCPVSRAELKSSVFYQRIDDPTMRKCTMNGIKGAREKVHKMRTDVKRKNYVPAKYHIHTLRYRSWSYEHDKIDSNPGYYTNAVSEIRFAVLFIENAQDNRCIFANESLLRETGLFFSHLNEFRSMFANARVIF